MMKRICPYCGARCKVSGGSDGNPYHEHNPEILICTGCGRRVPSFSNENRLEQTKASLEALLPEVEKFLKFAEEHLIISAISQGGGVERSAEIKIVLREGTHDLEGEYPFGRIDIDAKPPFQLQRMQVEGDMIYIAGESICISELPKTITKKLTAYGYGYVPWVEMITINIRKDTVQ